MGEAAGRLAGRVATITGGSTGIGRGIAELFVREGASVALFARDAKRLAATVEALDGGERVMAVPGDVGEPADVKRFIDGTIERFGRLDIHVSNAGIHRVVPFLETTDGTWDEVFRINVRGAFLACRAAAAAMRRVGGGSIVVVGSTNSFVAEPHMAA
jgi:3-hydroxybutyrate dehydrogenase